MKKILSFMLLAILTTFSSILYIKAQDEANTLVIYYYRYDNNYELPGNQAWTIWLWENLPDGKGGQEYAFSNNRIDPNYGSYIEIDLEDEGYGNTTRFGIIVKEGAGWSGGREPGGDRFFNLADMDVVNGKISAHIVEGDFNIGVNAEDLANDIPNYNDKILKADFRADGRYIDIRLTTGAKKVEIFENNTSIQTLNNTQASFSANIGKEVNLLNNYRIVATFASDEGDIVNEVNASISNLYDTDMFKNAFTYDGELGAIHTNTATTFRLWAPISEAVTLNLYNQGHPTYDRNGNPSEELTPAKTHEMTRIANGAWEVVVDGDLANTYYTFSVKNYGITQEVTDPYSYTTGANGMRSMVTNFAELNPNGWEYSARPNNITNLTDYIVYELHVRDLTTHESWNGTEENRGKFLGFTEGGTTYTAANGTTVTTGLDHLDELGINAVQLLPIFDFGYVDEVQMATNPLYANTFNWGYMPYHFNTLEGSYATNPFDGGVRVNEFKQLVQALHERDIRVIMDVVYNHTGESEGSNFHRILPGYYHRLTDEGNFYNGSGTGNETASERPMMRKFMLDSIEFLATEYNLSGFRFDLMALHDVQTMKDIEDMLYEIDPTIILYGEPWDADGRQGNYAKSDKSNIWQFENVGAFNDTTRDAIKGQGDGGNKAWIQGEHPQNHVRNIKYGIVGGINHNQGGITGAWHGAPQKTINYVTAHDNLTLNDKLSLTGYAAANKDAEKQRLQIQANAIVLTSQGVPFLHAGVDFMRSKPGVDGGYDHNSYESPDSVNQLRWDRKARYIDVFEYYKGLIHIRKHTPQLRLINSQDIINHLTFTNTNNNHIIQFEINHPSYPTVVVVHNGSGSTYRAALPSGKEFNVHSNLVKASPLAISTVSGQGTVHFNTTAIFIENVGTDNVGITQEVVTIDKDASFNPLSNFNYNAQNNVLYLGGFYDVSTPGRYNISATILDSKGNLIPLSYTLVVKGKGSNINIVGGLGL